MKKKRCTAIVLAAGRGSRMKSDVAKQYMLLRGKPLIWYALHAIEESEVIDDCILVTDKEAVLNGYAHKEIVERYGFRKVDTITAGGAERYDSVYCALQVIADKDMAVPNRDGYVFIHDGARPFLTEEILRRCYEAVEKYHACVAGMPVKDTIKVTDEEGYAAQTPDRTRLWQIQTPQVFDTPLICTAYEKLMQEKARLAEAGLKITDDAMVVETFTGQPVRLVEGSYRNIKVTTPEDIAVAEAFLTYTEGMAKRH
ncbi:MAG: 2-C-methyl-D-erythritol 4-phosphate cytidylyltransferase [Bacteroidales bacterium]|nr:2-C-methyl-D-erythritol 4-phosphate cytidylyltransferase [Bacteroidales bacterium]MCM1416546.1 2-C-methyl-D-erythritol 4-phosphate cytidylyltransferase [bacterium]MCM1424855.1 2-C-methyl-D-erythritol 4-phosphate cytidylyltransferase [bacterium]